MMRIALTLVAIYLAYCGLVYIFQRSLIFPRSVIPPFSDPVRRPGMEVLSIQSGKERVEAWFIPADPAFQGPRPAVIFAHGNAELIDFWPEYLKPFSQNGIHLLLVEYPGYGRSGGRPSENSIRGALTAAYDELVLKTAVDPARIILFGRSIGGGAVGTLAAVRPSAALILLSTFTSLRSFAPGYGLFPFIIRDPMDTLEVLRRYARPVLILHGTKDDLIPFSHARTLASVSRNARLVSYECGHNDCPPDWRVFWKDVLDFLREQGII